MNYYSHHIGDFDRATRHLTRLERSIYRDLLDVYYDTEAPLTMDMSALCRKIIARSDEESTAVQQVLNEFFIETPSGWYHERCEEELEAYRASNTQKSVAGKASAAKKAAKRQQALNGNQTGVESPLTGRTTDDERHSNGTPTNQEPRTNNQEPVKEKTSKSATPAALPDWIPTDAWGAFLAMRKAIKKPITAGAVPLAIAKLESLRSAGSDPRAVLEQSTLNSWQGLFEVKVSESSRPAQSIARASRSTTDMGANALDFGDPFAPQVAP